MYRRRSFFDARPRALSARFLYDAVMLFFCSALERIDRLLNGVTMYRLVVRLLFALAGYAIVLGFSGIISYDGLSLALSLLIVCVTCYVTNLICARLWKAPVNVESSMITALILFFVMYPATTFEDGLLLAASGALAMASKYVIAVRKKHVFNPVAISAVILGLSGYGSAVWWVGTPSLLPAVLIVGLLIVRKIRRFSMFVACIVASYVTAAAYALHRDVAMFDALVQHTVSWPIFFFASVMVTEPLTTPPRHRQRMAYGAFVGALSSWPISIGFVYFTPELALLIGNAFSYVVVMRRRLILRLKEGSEIAHDTYEFSFVHDPPPLRFMPGQYLEWTLPSRDHDSRGNRRYFTISSAPSEEHLKIGVKIMREHSSFKEELKNMKPGDVIHAGQLAGDFLLPVDTKQKLAFIAGGIGITPFRSMIMEMMHQKRRRDVVLFYGNRTAADVAYKDIFDRAASEVGLKTVHVLGETSDAMPDAETGYVDEEKIRRHAPDFKERMFYVSGPSAMVDIFKKLLSDMGVPRENVVTDYFPGFA